MENIIAFVSIQLLLDICINDTINGIINNYHISYCIINLIIEYLFEIVTCSRTSRKIDVISTFIQRALFANIFLFKISFIVSAMRGEMKASVSFQIQKLSTRH